MRVRVLSCRLAVGRPARVADAVVTSERIRFELGLQVDEFTGGTPDPDRTLAPKNRHSGRIVTAVLEPCQALEKNRNDVPLSHIADNSAH